MRDKRAKIEASVKEQTDALREGMAKLEAWIQAESDRTGVKSFKTDHGTAFLTTSDYASVGDWDSVLDYVKTNDAYDMLTRGVSKTVVRSYIDTTGAVPSGVNFGTKVSVSVRRPTGRE